MQIIGGIVAFLFLAAGVGWTARAVANMPRTPAPVRRGAAATAQSIRHPVRSARKGAPRAAQSVDAIWAKARSEDWLDRRRARRARMEERRASRSPREWRPRLPKVAVHVPGITDVAPQPKNAPAQPAPAKPALAVVPARPAQPSRPASPATPPAPERSSPMPALRNGSAPDHAAVNSRVAQYEPESDGDLIRFMQAEAAGLAGYASALEELAEHLLNAVGLDPAAIQGMTEVANAMTEAAAITTKACGKFQAVYQGVREDVAKGTRLPFHGRWITGESA